MKSRQVAYAVRIEGTLDAAKFAAAVSDVTSRHGCLWAQSNTSEAAEGPRASEVLYVDASGAPKDIEQLLRVELDRSLDALQGPLFRATVLKLAPADHLFVFVVEESACDRRSIDILLHEIAVAYDEQSDGAVSTERALLPSGVVRTTLEAGTRDVRNGSALQYFLRQLDGSLAPLELKSLNGRNVAALQRSHEIARFTLSAAELEALRSLADERGTTVELLLVAAFEVLLSRYSSQRDLRIGFRADNRGSDWTSAVGAFSNWLVLRSRFEDDPSFLELLDRVTATWAEASEHQTLAFEALSSALESDASPESGHVHVLHAAFSYHDIVLPAQSRAGWRFARDIAQRAASPVELALCVEAYADALVGWLEFDLGTLSEATAERFVRNFETVIAAIIEAPDTAVSRLRILHPSERAALLELNHTELPLPSVHGFYDLIWAQAARDPNRIAVVADDETLDYGELQRRARGLASYLIARGVRRHDRIGIALGRSSRLVQATLAVLSTGAAYVPLDPDFPRDRLSYMIEDADISLVIAERATLERLPPGAFERVSLDDIGAEVRARSSDELAVVNEPQDIAYVIYTSGSTGRPKGVEVPHRAVVNFLCSMARYPGFSVADRIVAVTTLSFDISVADLFVPLSVGARVIIADRDCLTNGRRLSTLIDQHGATVMQATPTTWQLLVDAEFEPPPGFRAMCGGEAFPGRLARELIARCSEVWNVYGPTETTVYSTCQRLTDPDATILVGNSLANTRTYVLDEHRELVPFGVAGELYIGGVCLAAGYLNRPELTSQRFIDDPFCPGERMYRTGDLARRWPEGIQVLGRADNQVKLRGHRIELGEIEAALEADDRIARSAVVVREVAANDSRLLAYVVAADGYHIDIGALRSSLREQLPDYMVPQHFIELEHMPLTPNGKIDRKALPALQLEQRNAAAAQPENAVEEALALLWREALRTATIGVNDNFFDIGGHSLLAVQLLQSINREFHTELELGFVFEAPTVREQARLLNEGRRYGGMRVVPLQSHGHETPLFCICGINLYQSLAREIGANRPVFGIFLPVEGLLLEGAHRTIGVREMAREYVRAIRSKQPIGPYNLAGVSFGAVLAYEVAQQLREQNEEVDVLAMLDPVMDEEPARSGGRLSDYLSRILRDPRGAVQSLRQRAVRELANLATGHETVAERLVRAVPDSIRARVSRWIPDLSTLQPDASDSVEGEVGRDEEFERLTALRDAHYEAAWAAYKPTMRTYDGSVVVFRASEQDRPAGRQYAADCGWSEYVSPERLHCHEIPGDHIGILYPPNVTVLAGILGRYLSSRTSASELAAE